MKATIYYNKNTGKIRCYCIAEVAQDMSFFGDDQEEMEEVLSYINVDYDTTIKTVLDNRNLFYVDPKSLIIKQKQIV